MAGESLLSGWSIGERGGEGVMVGIFCGKSVTAVLGTNNTPLG